MSHGRCTPNAQKGCIGSRSETQSLIFILCIKREFQKDFGPDRFRRNFSPKKIDSNEKLHSEEFFLKSWQLQKFFFQQQREVDLWEDFAKNELRSDSLVAIFLYVGNLELLPRNRRSIILFPF